MTSFTYIKDDKFNNSSDISLHHGIYKNGIHKVLLEFDLGYKKEYSTTLNGDFDAAWAWALSHVNKKFTLNKTEGYSLEDLENENMYRKTIKLTAKCGNHERTWTKEI